MFTMSTIKGLLLPILAAFAQASPTSELRERSTTWCGAFGSTSAGPYTIFHNNFGASTGSGKQCTTFSSLNGDSVTWSTEWSWSGGQGHVKSYSNVALQGVNRELTTVKSIPSTWSWQYTGSNLVADVSYDLWLAPSDGGRNEYEIMVWLAALGGAGPIGNPIATTTINGVNWTLHKGPNGSTTVFSFIAQSTINNWNGDLKPFFDYLTSRQGVSKNTWITNLQAGTEPFSGSNAVFRTSKYSMSVA